MFRGPILVTIGEAYKRNPLAKLDRLDRGGSPLVVHARGRSLSHRLLRDARVYGVLFQIDQDLAAAAAAAGCGCGGRLHSARYRRKPRCGLDLDCIDRGWSVRFSFCCDRDGCRRRTTPASVRFLGRRVYMSVVVLLIAVLAESATPARQRRLRQVVGDVSPRTVARWQRWWRETFPQTSLWREGRGQFAVPLATAGLPGALLARFLGPDMLSRVVALLRWLSPITVPSADPPKRGS